MTRLGTSLWILLLLASVPAGSASSKASAMPSDEEYAVYSAVVAGLLASGGDLVILDRTTSDDRKPDLAELRLVRPDFDSDTLTDYESKALETSPLESLIDAGLAYTLQTASWFDEIFSKGTRNGWNEFARQYPSGIGILRLSRVGINPEGTQAVVRVDFMCGGLCGVGEYQVLQKRETGWRVVQAVQIWVS